MPPRPPSEQSRVRFALHNTMPGLKGRKNIHSRNQSVAFEKVASIDYSVSCICVGLTCWATILVRTSVVLASSRSRVVGKVSPAVVAVIARHFLRSFLKYKCPHVPPMHSQCPKVRNTSPGIVYPVLSAYTGNLLNACTHPMTNIPHPKHKSGFPRKSRHVNEGVSAGPAGIIDVG